MVDDEVHEAGDDLSDAFADEAVLGMTSALLWLIMKAERLAVALALIGDKTEDAIAAESLKRWAEPQLVALMQPEDVATIPWPRVVRILRKHLPPIKD
jgi:hypothetical protein